MVSKATCYVGVFCLFVVCFFVFVFFVVVVCVCVCVCLVFNLLIFWMFVVLGFKNAV